MLLEDRYVDFICEHEITQSQFLLLYLLYKNRGDLMRKYKEVLGAEDGTMIGQIWIDKLVEKEWLHRDGKKYTISMKFKEVFCNKIDIAEELISQYPGTTEIDGKIVPLTAIDTIEVADLYSAKILESKKEHEEVIKDVKYAVTHNMINLSLKKFILCKYWLVIRKKRLSTADDGHIPLQSNSFG